MNNLVTRDSLAAFVGSDDLADRLIAAGFVKLPAARKTTPKPVAASQARTAGSWETYHPLHADAEAWLEQRSTRGFVSRHRAPRATAPLKPRAWTSRDYDNLARFNEMAAAAWRSLGHTVEVAGSRIDANGANVRVLS